MIAAAGSPQRSIGDTVASGPAPDVTPPAGAPQLWQKSASECNCVPHSLQKRRFEEFGLCAIVTPTPLHRVWSTGEQERRSGRLLQLSEGPEAHKGRC